MIVLQTMMWPDEVRAPDFSIEGGEVKRTPTSTKSSGEVVDLLAALQRSVEAARTARGEGTVSEAPVKKAPAKKKAS